MKKVAVVLSLLIVSHLSAQNVVPVESDHKAEEVKPPYDPETRILEEAKKEEETKATTHAASAETTNESTRELKSEQAQRITYVDMIKLFLLSNPQKNSDELVWALSDNDYTNTKNNDFAYQKIRSEKLMEAQKGIKASKDLKLELNVQLVLGNYDFKKETYPITKVKYTVPGMLLDIIDLANTPLYFSDSFNRSLIEKSGLTSGISLKIENINKLISMKVAKVAAEEISNSLSLSREVNCVIELDQPKFMKEKNRNSKLYNLNAVAKYSKGRCYVDEERMIKTNEF